MQYNKPPLAFMGNKKNMLKHIKQVLQDMQGDGNINDETIFLDVFNFLFFTSYFCGSNALFNNLYKFINPFVVKINPHNSSSL